MAMDIPPMEDVVYALMQHLVVPWLPSVSFVRETHEALSLSEQETVAKQVHAVVVLYNYYHKKQQPNAETLQFKLFCQLAVIIKHSLMGHLKIMHYADLSGIDDVENHLSLTEKAVMSALDISTALDPSKNFPSIENWEVSGVAVLLVNSTQEKCFLQYGSVIKGVWSLIERDIQIQGAKNERIKRKRRDNKSQVDKPALLPLALSAVEEETGMNANVVLESHTVYSLSREKRAVQFYIVQSVQSIDKDFHPIKDVVERLQGPLFRTRDDSWKATAVVEYFHLLPYAEVIKAWFSRSLKSKPGFEAKEHNQDVDDSLVQKNESGSRGVGLQDVNENNSQIHPQEHNQDVDDHPFMVNCRTNQQTMDVDDSLVQKNDTGTGGVGLQDVNENNSQIHPQEHNQDVDDHPFMVNCRTNQQTMDVDDSLVQKNDSGTGGLGLQDVKENNSQIHLQEHNQDVDDPSSMVGCHINEQTMDVDDSLVQKNDSGTKVGLQYVYENNSQIHPQEHNKDVVDHPSMVDCHTNQQTMNVDDSLVQMNDSGTVGLGLENVNENKSQIHPQELNQDVGDNPSMVDFHTKEQTMDVDDSLAQKNDSGTGGLRLENVNENISQIHPKEHSQDDGDHPSMVDCHSNQQTMDIDDSLVQKNDSGTKVGLQVVIDNNSQISPKEHNQDVDDTSMVDCQTNQQTMDVDDPSIVHKICKQTYGNKIDVESSKKVTNNGNVMIGLDECHTDQQIMDTDKQSMPNGKTNSDSNGSNQSGISVGFLEQISEKPNFDGGDSSTVQLQNGNKEKNDGPLIVYSRRKKRSSNIKANGKTDELKEEIVGQADEVNKMQIIKGSGPTGRAMGDQSNTECQTMLQVSQVPKKLLQILLKVLLRKKTKLAHQLRELEGEIAVCEKSIQTIMDGKIEGEDEVEAILNFIDFSYKGEAEAQVKVSQPSGIQVQPIPERKKLSDAVIPSLDPCQQLDVICDTNCWSLPTYQVYPVEGRYRASIKLEGADFEYCEEGNLCVKKSLARESVAGKMIAKLQSVSSKSH